MGSARGLSAQHCGGPCEVARIIDPVTFNPRYSISEGVERSNWRWMHNWYWTEHGVQRHHLEPMFQAPPLRDFARRFVFVSPSGNGFLVTGNPYADASKLEGREPPLIVFCDPQGKRLAEVMLTQVAEEQDRRRGPCPSCTCCEDILYELQEAPTLSANGCYVDILDRRNWLRFWLPFECLVRDRNAFDAALEAAEWSQFSSTERAQQREQIAALLVELGVDDLDVRTRAAAGLTAKGYLALTAVRRAHYESKSGNFRARAKAVELQLRPLASAPWEQLPRDLGLLGALLTYQEPDVVKAIQTRLQHIVPQVAGMDVDHCTAWIKQHSSELTWNAAKGHYEQ